MDTETGRLLREISALNDELSEVKKKLGEDSVKTDALYSFFLKSSPDDPQGMTRAKRIMDVVQNAERGRWVVLWSVRIVATIGAIAGAIGGVLALKGGLK